MDLDHSFYLVGGFAALMFLLYLLYPILAFLYLGTMFVGIAVFLAILDAKINQTPNVRRKSQ